MNKYFNNGFTLIELLVVMAIIGTLLTIAAPRYFHSLDRSQEAVLHQNLELTRQALDKYFGDNGKYPDNLEDLVGKKYLRCCIQSRCNRNDMCHGRNCRKRFAVSPGCRN